MQIGEHQLKLQKIEIKIKFYLIFVQQDNMPSSHQSPEEAMTAPRRQSDPSTSHSKLQMQIYPLDTKLQHDSSHVVEIFQSAPNRLASPVCHSYMRLPWKKRVTLFSQYVLWLLWLFNVIINAAFLIKWWEWKYPQSTNTSEKVVRRRIGCRAERLILFSRNNRFKNLGDLWKSSRLVKEESEWTIPSCPVNRCFRMHASIAHTQPPRKYSICSCHRALALKSPQAGNFRATQSLHTHTHTKMITWMWKVLPVRQQTPGVCCPLWWMTATPLSRQLKALLTFSPLAPVHHTQHNTHRLLGPITFIFSFTYT